MIMCTRIQPYNTDDYVYTHIPTRLHKYECAVNLSLFTDRVKVCSKGLAIHVSLLRSWGMAKYIFYKYK